MRHQICGKVRQDVYCPIVGSAAARINLQHLCVELTSSGHSTKPISFWGAPACSSGPMELDVGSRSSVSVVDLDVGFDSDAPVSIYQCQVRPPGVAFRSKPEWQARVRQHLPSNVGVERGWQVDKIIGPRSPMCISVDKAVQGERASTLTRHWPGILQPGLTDGDEGLGLTDGRCVADAQGITWLRTKLGYLPETNLDVLALMSTSPAAANR